MRLAPIGFAADLRLPAPAQEMDGMSGSDMVQTAQNAAKLTVLSGRRKVSEVDLRHALSEAHDRHASR